MVTNILFEGGNMMDASNLIEFGHKIRQLRKDKGYTQDQLAKEAGISKPYLSNIETGRTVGPPSHAKLQQLEVALGLPRGQLCQWADWQRVPESLRKQMGGLRESAAVTDNPNPDEPPTRPSLLSERSDDTHDVPERFYPIALKKTLLINRVAAGTPMEATDLDYPANVADRDILIPDELVDGCFALRIDGDSMMPLYQPGDIVVFSADRTPLDGNDCLVRLGDGDNFSTTFKRIHFVDASGVKQKDGDYVFLEPLNSAHTPRIVRRDDLTGIYPALWKISPIGTK